MNATTTDAATIEAADHAARYWSSPQPGPLKPGSEAHKRAVCQMFHDTFNPYKPSVIAWPKLDDATRDKIISLPIWDIAVQTEGKARLRMAAYARTLADPDMGKTIELNGWEENRHKEVLSKLVEAYGIPLEPEPEYKEPRDPEWAYMVTGYSECIDSFFAFGLFELAKRSGFFPAELVETFEPVMQEECRHILLFANWVAWHRATMPIHKRVWFELRVAAVYAFLGWERIGIARGMDDKGGGAKTQDNNFTVSGSKSVSAEDISVPELMRICLEENDRRFAGYDRRLLRPTTMPTLVRIALKFMPKKKRA
ncbi:MAG: ferritin-like domain-containing protein [Acidiphilium sp.]